MPPMNGTRLVDIVLAPTISEYLQQPREASKKHNLQENNRSKLGAATVGWGISSKMSSWSLLFSPCTTVHNHIAQTKLTNEWTTSAQNDLR
eukprot:810378-Amphidinium_carterae.1